MKHIFVLNPVAGKGNADSLILPEIIKEVKGLGIDYEIHRTINVGEATNYVSKKCKQNSDENIRFYAIGGDGTLNEVANGAVGHHNAEIAFIPAGTGNDFARVFTNYKYFNDINRQLNGIAKPIDLIKCNDNYIVNMLNIGLDCDAALKAAYFKNNTFLRGQLAYIAGVLTVFVANKGSELTISLENGEKHVGEFTLVAIGNGAFCGGGFKGVPKAKLDDGLLDASIIRKVSRRTFVAMINEYRKGTHLDHPDPEGIFSYIQCKNLNIKTNKETMICADGNQIFSNELSISIQPNAIKFSVPEGCESN